ncbi:MAG: ribosomal protein S18-alanine N-acetyltransferase [Clostridiales bacterium]|nr:ribosomal protein S18-alanine N-acetyltransferase [Clostridiales bacterium]
MSDSLLIRRAFLSDVSNIAAAENAYIDCPWTEEQITAELTKDNALFFVATINGEFAGYVSALCAADECEIANIAVTEGLRRHGVATKLLLSLIASAKQLGASSVYLLVSEANSAAKALYGKLGFSEVGRRKSYYGTSDAVIMRLNV